MADELGSGGYKCTTSSFEAWYKDCCWEDYAFELVKPTTSQSTSTQDGITTTAILREGKKDS